MAKQLTEKQEAFLKVLFSEANGDLLQAKRLAGYSENTPTSDIAQSLAEEISELTKKFISSSATKAAYSLYQVMNDPTELGNKEKMVAAKDILDRGGFVKTDKVEVTAASLLVTLPPKNDEN